MALKPFETRGGLRIETFNPDGEGIESWEGRQGARIYRVVEGDEPARWIAESDGEMLDGLDILLPSSLGRLPCREVNAEQAVVCFAKHGLDAPEVLLARDLPAYNRAQDRDIEDRIRRRGGKPGPTLNLPKSGGGRRPIRLVPLSRKRGGH